MFLGFYLFFLLRTFINPILLPSMKSQAPLKKMVFLDFAIYSKNARTKTIQFHMLLLKGLNDFPVTSKIK